MIAARLIQKHRPAATAITNLVARAVRPYKVAFQVVGPAPTVQRLVATKPLQLVVIAGALRCSGGARTLLLGAVEDSTAASDPH